MIKKSLLIVITAFAFSCTKAPVINESEKEWLKNHPDLSIGISPNQPPYQFISEKGEIKGMFIDFLTNIEDRLDYKFIKKYQPDWAKLLSDAKEGNIDIVLQIQETDERKDFLRFTPYLLSHKHVFVTKNTRDDIASVSDLKDKKIAVAHSYAVLDYLLKNYPDFTIQPLFDNVAGLRAVATGQADAFLTQQAVATYYIETEGISNLKIAGEIDYPNELAIASRKDLDTLNIILSKAVNSITKTEKQTIYNHWLSYEVKPFYAEVKFWIVILVVILVTLTFVILFNLALRKRVKQKTNELKVAKEKSEENYALLRIAVEKAKLGGWNVDLKENHCYWSDEVAAIHEMPLGYAPLVEDGINFYAPEWREKIKKVFTECAQYGIPYDEEMEIITSTGNKVWVRTIGEAVRDGNGNIYKVEGAFQDITENKRADEAIRKAHDQLTKIILTSPNIICSAHLQSDGTVCFPFGGERLAEYFGIPEANLARDSSPYAALIHPDDNENMYASIMESAKQLSPWRCEYRMVHPVKGVLWIEGHSMPNRETDGSTLWHGVVTDITERKRTEDKVIASQTELKKALEISNQSRQKLLSVLEDQKKAKEDLRETNNYLESLFNYTTAPIIVWDPTLKITRFNSAFEQLSGFGLAEVIGQKVSVLFPEDKIQSSLSLINKTATGEKWDSVEIEILRKDKNTKIVLWNSSNILDKEEKAIVATIALGYDITQRKISEEEIRRQLDELQRWQAITIGRESRVREIKREVNELLIRMGEPIRYPSQGSENDKKDTGEGE